MAPVDAVFNQPDLRHKFYKKRIVTRNGEKTGNDHLMSSFHCRIASAEKIFRWIIVLSVSLIPVTTYGGSRLLFLSRTHSLLTASMILAINSYMQVGFELGAFLVQGMYQQLFALVLLPLTSKHYFYLMQYFTLFYLTLQSY